MPAIFNAKLWHPAMSIDVSLNRQESQPTCETRLPRSPGLACGAARPCKQPPSLTLCHMPPPSLHKALIARHACMHPYDKLESKPTCEDRSAQKPRSGARGAARSLQAVTVSHLVSDACPSQCKSSDNLPCQIDISVDRQSLDSPVRPVCPEAPVWPVERARPLQAVTVSHLVSDACPSQCKALIARHACMHPYDKLESKPTCETGLPRSPGLACGAARPLQALTVVSPCVTCLPFSMQSSGTLPCQ